MRIRSKTTASILLAAVALAGGCASDAEKKQAAGELYQQGQVCAAAQKTDDAAKKYEEALKKNPGNVPALHALAQIQTDQKKFKEAVETWRRVVAATNGSADAWNDLAFCQDLAGWNMPTESSYLEALAANPKHQRARINYGLFLARHDRSPEAICQLQLALPPAQAHYNLGVALDEVHKTRQARVEYRKALTLQPNFPEAEARLNSGESSARTE